MDAIVLMVGRPNERVYDIEVMPDVPVEKLADAISQAFGWQGAYDMQYDKQILPGSQTLAEASIWDGAQIVMLPSSRVLHPASSNARVRRLIVPSETLSDSPAPGDTPEPKRASRPLVLPGASSHTNQANSPNDSSPIKGWRKDLSVNDSNEQS